MIDRNLASGDGMEKKSAETGREESDGGIESYQKWNQYCGTESYKHELNSDNGSFQWG